MEDYTDAEFSGLLDQLAQLPVEDRASDLLKLLKTLLTKNVTVQDWNTLIRDIAPLYATMLGLNDCMVNLINKVQRELGIVTGSSNSALHRIIALEDGTRGLANTKFDKTGGTITGPVTVTDKLDVQSLTVHGTTTTTDTTHLSVKDAIIETNVGAETAESIPLLSGYVIHIGNGNAYGIVYDKVAQSVKLGLVEKTAEGKYRFQNGEGQAVALRADTNDLITGRLAVWNGNANRFETKFQVAQDATRMTIVQRTTDGEVLTADPRSDNAAVPKSWLEGRYSTSLEITGRLQLISDALTQAKNEIDAELGKRLKAHENTSSDPIPYYPVIPKLVRKVSNDPTQGFYQAWEQLSVEAINKTVPQRTAYGAVQTKDPRTSTDSVNLQYADGHYVAKIGKATQVGTILYGRDFNGNEKGYIVESIAHNANSIVQRKSGGAIEVGKAVADSDAMPKKQVEDGFVAKHSEATATHQAYVKNPDGTQAMMGMARTTAAPNTVVVRDTGGTVKVGTPAAPKDAVNLEYLAAQLGAVTGASPYFVHNICIKQTVDNVVNTIRVTLTCTKVAKFTSVSELREAIVQLGGDAENSNTPMWYGTCKVWRYMGMNDSDPESTMAYSGYIGLWNSPKLQAWADNVYPDASYSVTLDDTNWTVSDNVLNMVMGGTTA